MKISIHRALAELKLLEKRIERASAETFIGSSTNGKAPKGYSSLTEFEKSVKASYDSVTSLIKRRNLIKNAIIKSNAETQVTIAGNKFTVAEAIDQKAFIEHEENLLRMMKRQYQQVMEKFHKDEEIVQRELTLHLESAFPKDSEAAPEVRKSVEEAFLVRRSAQLIDPLELREKIAQLETKIENFRNEIDYSLSESNASTKIEVPEND